MIINKVLKPTLIPIVLTNTPYLFELTAQDVTLIGVIANDNEKEIVREFFELFKTPWEFYKKANVYDVVICSGDPLTNVNTGLLVLYSSEKIRFDCENKLETASRTSRTVLEYENYHFPVYIKLQTFCSSTNPLITVTDNTSAAAIELINNNKKIIRIGFNVFQEIQYLLSSGQPAEFAHVPTLEIHISILRNIILSEGIPLIEIPPIPAGYNFVVCLTHDVDFAGIRRHKLDQTIVGFLYRALFGSLRDVLKRKKSWRNLYENWKSVLLLPAVYAGLAEDFWIQFDRYIEVEDGLRSTFFIIPFKNQAGIRHTKDNHARRATRYDVSDIKDEMQRLLSNNCEIGVHGIDAWKNVEKGRTELERINEVTGAEKTGVRMHWLYFNDLSPKILEDAGFFYDSSVGYNDAVGYRAGTSQVFRPFGLNNLLELPLHIQDTALFFPDRMDLTEVKAWLLINNLLENGEKYGGVLTINWHDRSMAPERLWGDFYINLLKKLKTLNIWFGSAAEVVRWFNKRRSVTFDEVQLKDGKLSLKLKSNQDNMLPDLMARIHKPITRQTEEPPLSIEFSDKLDTQMNLI